MRLTSAQVKSFKSIEDSGEVPIDARTTVLVGQNESGKTAFLQALSKARSVEDGIAYNVTEDYPRRGLTAYQKQHAIRPADVAVLTYEMEKEDLAKINKQLGFDLLKDLAFSVTHKYDGSKTIGLSISERPYIDSLVASANLTSEVCTKTSGVKTINELIQSLKTMDLNETGKTFLSSLETKFKDTPAGWSSLQYVVWKEIEPGIPHFLYFDDYKLLPGKINLANLQQRVNQAKSANQPLDDEEKTILSLLRMADVNLSDFTATSGYETIKAKLEGISNSITDKIFEYWKQNRELDVEFDIRSDASDKPPYNNGDNLYIRIRNRRHRVTVPFSQRSRGFIWFFSFLVWFDSIREQLNTKKNLILLLDEPGLNLHALAQADFLEYIDTLSQKYQVLYTTHSPFMVRNDRLDQVRTVEDKDREGTKLTSNISSSNPKTIFPLQAALGYSIAQNLFISKRNLLVEGPADLVYLQFFSGYLEHVGRSSLRHDVTIVPAGGLDKIATFVALLGGNKLEMCVLHDYRDKPEAHLENLVRGKLINDKHVHHYGMYRQPNQKFPVKGYLNTDVEDLIDGDFYLELFNLAYKSKLSSPLKLADLPPGDRIVERIERFLASNNILLRPSGGFNHYLPAQQLVALSPVKIDEDTLKKFEYMFTEVNALYSGAVEKPDMILTASDATKGEIVAAVN